MTNAYNQNPDLIAQPKPPTTLGQGYGMAPEKAKIQITWRDIYITAKFPPKGKCCQKKITPEPKEIIRGVSGTVMPG